MRKSFIVLAGLGIVVLAIFLFGLSEARRDPIVRYGHIPLADWPKGEKPVRVLLMSDVHLGSMAMDAPRLTRIADQAVALKPDLILLAGDYIAGHDAATAVAVAPDLAAALARLHAPLGVVAVLGNHDHWTDATAVRRALMAAKIRVLTNDAIERGPLAIGGIDDKISGNDDIFGALAAMDRLKGAKVILTHSPDVALVIRTGSRVLLTGHSHCGQIVIPGLGPVKTVIDSRETYHCGAVREGPDRLIVTGGVGTSVLPMRIGAPPDLWVITFGPAG